MDISDEWYYIVGLVVAGCFILVLGITIGKQGPPPVTAEYQNHITGLNVVGLEPGNYSYPITITNPYDNVSVAVYTYLFSDPENLTNYATLSCSVLNGTILTPYETVVGTFGLEVVKNPFGELGEFYIRVGCLKEGVDY